MHREFQQNPYEHVFPEVVEQALHDYHEESSITCCQFNRHGHLLATGCSNGRAHVWDFETRGVAKTLRGHTGTVNSLSWSRTGRRLLTASADGTCILWDLADEEAMMKQVFDVPILSAHMHPRKERTYLVCPMQGPIHVLRVPSSGSPPKEEDVWVLEDSPLFDASVGDAANATKSVTYQAIWDRTGEHILVASSKNVFKRYHAKTRQCVNTIELEKGAAAKNLALDKSGTTLILNCNDRTLRLYNLSADGELTLRHRFKDLVNNIHWARAVFSPDGEHLFAAAANRSKHTIYIYDRHTGNLIKILEGPSEGLDDFSWHPERPILAAVSSIGRVLIWSTIVHENWSAFAPDFRELEENLEYHEREDEFDIVPEDVATHRKQAEEDAEVDILTIPRKDELTSSDMEDTDSEAEENVPQNRDPDAMQVDGKKKQQRVGPQRYWRPTAIPNSDVQEAL